jgi:two-component system sensor histidine kinase/response regulator
LPETPLVLVVDDSRLGRRVAEALLSQLGCRAELVESGAQALERLAARSFDAVLMDCQMPGMDGFEVTARIRSGQAGAPDTPIVAVTANDGEGNRERCLAAGMDDHLAKPLTAASLEPILRRVLGGETPALDPGTIDSLRGYRDAGLLKELAKLFLLSLPERMAGLRAAHAGHDHTEVARLAHALKGNAGNVGALEMSRLCSSLEAGCRAGESEGVGGLLGQLEVESARVAAALRGLL